MVKVKTIPFDELKDALSALCPNPKRIVLKCVYPILKEKAIYIFVVNLLPELGYNSSKLASIFKKLSRIDEKIKLAFEN